MASSARLQLYDIGHHRVLLVKPQFYHLGHGYRGICLRVVVSISGLGRLPAGRAGPR